MSELLFSTKVVDFDDGPTIYVQGEIDMTGAGRLRDAIEPHMGPRQTIILDFSGVDFVDPRASTCSYKPADRSPRTAVRSSCGTPRESHTRC